MSNITEGKGLEGKNCNVTACQEPTSAFYYNNVTKAFYCEKCAKTIERFANLDGMSFYDNLFENVKEAHKQRRNKLLSSDGE